MNTGNFQVKMKFQENIGSKNEYGKVSGQNENVTKYMA